MNCSRRDGRARSPRRDGEALKLAAEHDLPAIPFYVTFKTEAPGVNIHLAERYPDEMTIVCSSSIGIWRSATRAWRSHSASTTCASADRAVRRGYWLRRPSVGGLRFDLSEMNWKRRPTPPTRCPTRRSERPGHGHAKDEAVASGEIVSLDHFRKASAERHLARGGASTPSPGGGRRWPTLTTVKCSRWPTTRRPIARSAIIRQRGTLRRRRNVNHRPAGADPADRNRVPRYFHYCGRAIATIGQHHVIPTPITTFRGRVFEERQCRRRRHYVDKAATRDGKKGEQVFNVTVLHFVRRRRNLSEA